jgi:hypothetical protein
MKLVVGLLIGLGVIVLVVFLIRPVLTDQTWREVATYAGLLVAGSFALGTLRVRCLRCEPDWSAKMYGKKAKARTSSNNRLQRPGEG